MRGEHAGGGAIRPGDVLKAAGGRTVEVIDTDAEGRLVLADALWYAQQAGATHLVDVATLTGACQVALGKVTIGLMGRPAAWVEHVREVANRAGDRAWVLPLYEDTVNSSGARWRISANVGGRPAGAITAAMFLREFAGDLPWAHFDIAGTAWVDEAETVRAQRTQWRRRTGAGGARVQPISAAWRTIARVNLSDRGSAQLQTRG